MREEMAQAFDKITAEHALIEKTQRRLQERMRQGVRRHPPLRLAMAVASLLLVVLLGGFSYRLYLAPAAFVDMAVNPSVELTVNRLGRVISADAYNEDGAALLLRAQIKHKPYEEAVRLLLDDMLENAQLEGEGLVSITVQTRDAQREAQMLSHLHTAVAGSLDTHHATAVTELYAVPEAVKTHAHARQVSPARYLAIEELMEVDPATTFEGCAHRSMGELRELLTQRGGHHEPGGHSGDGHRCGGH